jgi:uncharacterized protein
MSSPKRLRRPYRGPIIDVHFHPMLGAKPSTGNRPHSIMDYDRSRENLDIRYVGSLAIAPRSDLQLTRKMNDDLLALGRRTRGRFYPMCSVHPLDGKAALKEIDRVAHGGAKGLKLHPNTQNFDVADPRVRAVVERSTEHGLPVLLDAYSPFDSDQPGKFIRLAMDVPESRLILAHAHGPRFPDLLVYEILSRYPWWKRNVWIDVSATASLLAGGPLMEAFGWVLCKVGTDRILFGSDYPMDSPTNAARAVCELGLSGQDLERVFFSNAAELFGLG